MAILATIFAALGRFAGKILTTTLGWASALLFGRVPQDRQILLVLITFGSVIWAVLVAGVIVPEVGTFTLALVPIPEFVDRNLVRLAMLAAAFLVPLPIGLLTLLILPPERRPKGADAAKAVLRGYPLTVALAVVLVFLAVIGVVRKGRALVKRWKDAHVPIVVEPGGYDRMVDDLEQALDETGLEVTEHPAPVALATPARLMAAVGGAGVKSLVPDRMVQLTGRDLEIELYPSDIAIAGTELNVNRARAAIASRLTASTAFLTTSAEAQRVEERLRELAHRRQWDAAAQRELAAIDEELARIEIPYEEWEVLYRTRLQVERDLVTGRQPGATPGEAPGSEGRRPLAAPTDGHRSPVEYAAAAGLVGLVVADLVLAVRDRGR